MATPIAAERWSDWACAGGVSTGSLVVCDGTYGDALDNTDACQLTYLHDPRVAVSLRDVIRLTDGTGTVGGINSGEIYAICKDGTRVQGQFVMGSSTTSGTGTATDTRGNTYKLMF